MPPFLTIGIRVCRFEHVFTSSHSPVQLSRRFIGMAVEQLIAQATLQAALAMEQQLDAELDQLDRMDEDDIEKMRERRFGSPNHPPMTAGGLRWRAGSRK